MESIKSLPNITKVCFLLATAIAGRNVLPAIGCKIGSLAINCMDKRRAFEWRRASNDYWTKAKKDGIRDLTAAAGVIVLGIGAAYSGEFVEKLTKEEEKPESRIERLVNRIFDWGVSSKEILSDVKNSFDQTISNQTEGLKYWAWSLKPTMIDSVTGIGFGWIANYVRVNRFSGDPLRDIIKFSLQERTFNVNNQIVNFAKWYFINRPRNTYHRSDNPIYSTKL